MDYRMCTNVTKYTRKPLIPTHWDQGVFEYLLVEEQIISHKGI